MLFSWSSKMFLSAVMMVLPAITALLMVNVSFGVMAKASPQLNPFSVGFLITIILGFSIIYVTFPTLVPYFAQIMDDIFQLVKDILIVSAETSSISSRPTPVLTRTLFRPRLSRSLLAWNHSLMASLPSTSCDIPEKNGSVFSMNFPWTSA